MKTRDAAHEDSLNRALEFLRDVWALNHAIELTSMRMEARLGVTAQQRMMIRIVGRFPGITAGQLARLLHVDAGTVSTTIRRLEQRGLMKRRADPEDRRRVSLGLTAAGERIDVPAPGTVESAVEAALAATSDADREITRRVIARIIAALDEGRSA